MKIIENKKTENTHLDNGRMELLSSIRQRLQDTLMGTEATYGIHDLDPSCGAEKEQIEILIGLTIKTIVQVEQMNRGYLARSKKGAKK